MKPELYNGYIVWGYALPRAGQFVASGTITRAGALVHACGKLDAFRTEDEALAVGLAWARAFVDSCLTARDGQQVNQNGAKFALPRPVPLLEWPPSAKVGLR